MTNDERRFIIDLMTWSFSRLNSFDGCKYEWLLKYIEEPGNNANSCYGQFGSLCHGLLENYANGEIHLFDLPNEYERRFLSLITEDFPKRGEKDFRQEYFDKGYDYFCNFEGFGEDMEVLGVEKKVDFVLDGYKFIGYIDLLLRNQKTNEIIILDHKSSSLKFKKNGELSKSSLPKFDEFKKQLYLYSIPVVEEYGHVDKLQWNLFKDQNSITVPWKKNEFEETKSWALDMIHQIENETEWDARPDYMYCYYLCSKRRDGCPYKYQTLDK